MSYEPGKCVYYDCGNPENYFKNKILSFNDWLIDMYFRSDYFQGMFSSGWMEGGESHNLKLPIKVIKGVVTMFGVR